MLMVSDRTPHTTLDVWRGPLASVQSTERGRGFVSSDGQAWVSASWHPMTGLCVLPRSYDHDEPRVVPVLEGCGRATLCKAEPALGCDAMGCDATLESRESKPCMLTSLEMAHRGLFPVHGFLEICDHMVRCTMHLQTPAQVDPALALPVSLSHSGILTQWHTT